MKQMGIYPAQKMVFIKAGLRVWSRWGFFRREKGFSVRQGLRIRAQNIIFSKLQASWRCWAKSRATARVALLAALRASLGEVQSNYSVALLVALFLF